MHVVALNDEGRGVAVVVFRRQFAAEEAAFVFEVICRFRHNPIVEPIMAIFSLFWRRMCRMQRDVVYSKEVARVCSSVDRASVSGTEGRGFDPHQAHQHGFRLTAGSFCIFGACKAGAGVGNGKAGDAGSLGSWKNRPVWRER